MKLAKSLLLGSAAALVATAGASAADLPSKKAAPVQYVKVCDAYGAGFFNIPGTDTCLKVGGRVRADYAYVSAQQQIVTPTAHPFAAPTVVQATISITSAGTVTATSANIVYQGYGTRLNVSDILREARSMHTNGWETRGRVELDARTSTAWGTVQTVAALRLAHTTGVLALANGAESSSAGATLEAAYVRFSGFTFGAARDNFAFMPSRFYGAGHWGSFANGAKQIAYTAVLGGGISATVALQDPIDTTVGGYDYTFRDGTAPGSLSTRLGSQTARLPQLNGRIDFDQNWGSVSLAGAVRQIDMQSTTAGRYSETETAWAAGLGVKLNLPQLAKGDAIWFTAAYADGMTEYTTNWSSFKSSAYRSDVGGFVINHPSYISLGGDGTNGPANSIETVKSWNVAAVMDHFWTPQWRSSFLASYGEVKAPNGAKNCSDGISSSSRYVANSKFPVNSMLAGCFGDATVWNVGKQIAFLPARNFEIGVEALYARTTLKMPSGGSTGSSSDWNTFSCYNKSSGETCSQGNWTGRLRVERTF